MYTVQNHPENSFEDYATRLDMTADTRNIPWPECVTLVGNVSVIADGSYVLTHDSSQLNTLCMQYKL